MGILHKLIEGLERRYIIYTLLSPAAMVGEVVMEVSIPMIMAKILDNGVSNQDVEYTIRIGLLMVGAALLSLCCGVLSARFAAVASAGFARNLRFRLFSKVQDMSFAGVDRFGTASLVTRLTTDVTNAQNTYQMAIRICVRAPVMLISATCMAFFVNSQLASLFLIIIPVLAVLLGIIGSRAFPRFRKMLTQYDKLNSTVQENLTGIRVVKSFVREDSESAKFEQTADELRRAQLAAEKIIIWNGPVMQLSMYTAIIAVLWSAGHMITAGSMQPGALVGFFSYITQILMSLMMLSMIFVLLVLARASIARIVEVLDWENDIRYGGNPEIEFVGDPRDKHGYGVYQKPIINLASKYKTGMVDYTGHSLNQVLNIVKGGTPVQVWVSINLKNTSVCADWIHKASGKKINWICNLHSVVIVGFNDNYVYASDPYTGKIEKYKRNTFQSRYNLFGKRAIYFS